MYARADPSELKKELSSLRDNFLSTSTSRDVNSNWDYFTDGLFKIIKKLIPVKVVRTRQDLPWLSRELRKKIKHKNRLHWKAKKSKPRKSHRWRRYTRYQNALKQDIKASYNRYMDSLFEDDCGNPTKKFFRAIKARRRDQVGIPPLRSRKKKKKLETTPKGKATILSEQYSSIFKKEDISTVPDLGRIPYPQMHRISVSSQGIINLLQRLNPTKAIGPDKVPTCILKDHADLIAPMLKTIFQKSLDTGKVPSVWKTADVVAIFKKGDKHAASNYRPVSLTSVSCKVLEHIIFRAIMDHVDFHKILNHFQHGFRTGHSCETQLINTTEDLAKGLNNRQQLDLLILDFSEAFDVVGHKRLLRKLFYYGIRDLTLTWLEDWLTGRTQRVGVEGQCSEEAPVTSGVPQGTVLIPLMFILYINDINSDTCSSIRLFADECLLYRVVECTRDAAKLQGDLTQLCRWARDWQMDFNASKCHVLSISRKQKPVLFPYTISGVQLECVRHHPYLGVELSSYLNWGTHLDISVPKAQRSLNLLRRNLYSCSPSTKELAYKTLVQPILEYVGSAWDPHQANHIHRLESVQRRAARFVSGQHDRAVSVTNIMASLGWRSLQERRLESRLCMLYKTIKGTSACNIPSYIHPHSTSLRASHDQQYRVPHTTNPIDAYTYSFFPRTIRIWNILPAALVHASTIEGFKNGLHKKFLSGNMYVVSPRGQYDRPRLGSSASLPVVGPVY